MNNSMTREEEGRFRQYERLLLSYADFKHAKLVSSYVLGQKLHDSAPGESSVLLEALNCSMIISYARPFSGNDQNGKRKIPDLPSNFTKILNSEEREIHQIVLNDRNKVLAHSDSEALNVLPVVWKVNENIETIVPVKNWGLAPLTKEATIIFSSAAEKMFQEALRRRDLLEPYLKKFFKVVDTEGMAKVMGGEEPS